MDKKIIFLFGAPRSGTTMLGGILGKSNSIRYIGENRWLFLYIHLGLTNFKFFRKFYKTQVNTFIQKFKETIILDKTPSNCLISSELIEVFEPEKTLYIHRDLKQVFPSALAEWKGKINERGSLDSFDERKKKIHLRILNKLKYKGFIYYRILHPFWWPTFFIDFFWGFSYIIRSYLNITFLWGPINLKIFKYFLFNTVEDSIKLQWFICNCRSLNTFIDFSVNVFKIDYSKLCLDSDSELKKVYEYLDILPLKNNIKQINRNYKNVDNELQDKINELFNNI